MPGTYTISLDRKEWSVVRLFSTLMAVVSAQYWTATLMRDSHLRHLCWYTKFTGAAAYTPDEAPVRKPSEDAIV